MSDFLLGISRILWKRYIIEERRRFIPFEEDHEKIKVLALGNKVVAPRNGDVKGAKIYGSSIVMFNIIGVYVVLYCIAYFLVDFIFNVTTTSPELIVILFLGCVCVYFASEINYYNRYKINKIFVMKQSVLIVNLFFIVGISYYVAEHNFNIQFFIKLFATLVLPVLVYAFFYWLMSITEEEFADFKCVVNERE